MFRIAFLTLLLALVQTVALAQEIDRRGSMFLYWGYNRAWYTASDIHLYGPGYDLTLRDVRAKDRPSTFDLATYCSPASMWIPQYNYRVGWFLRNGVSLSLGMDHMKYVVQQDQEVLLEGRVDAERSARHARPAGSSGKVVLSEDLLRYEHTDGLNLLSVDLDKYQGLWHNNDHRFRLDFFAGAHAGAVIPRSDVRVFGEGINNRFNVAGYGLGAQTGLHITLFKHGFIRNTLRAGYIDLPKVLTTGSADTGADQHFWFVQHAITAGVLFHLLRR